MSIYEETKHHIISAAKSLLDGLEEEDRLEVFGDYCQYCGVKREDDKPCTCVWDE